METAIQSNTLFERLVKMLSSKRQNKYGENALQNQMFARVIYLVEDKRFLEETVSNSTEGGQNVCDILSDAYIYLTHDRTNLVNKFIIAELQDSTDELQTLTDTLCEQDSFCLKQLIDIRNIIFA